MLEWVKGQDSGRSFEHRIRLAGLEKERQQKVLVSQSCLILCNPWTVALQVPLSMEFSRQEYWSELSFPSPGDLPKPGIESGSPPLQAGSLLSEAPRKPQTGLIKKEMFVHMQ